MHPALEAAVPQKLALLLLALLLLFSTPHGSAADEGDGPPDGRKGGPPAGRGRDAMQDRVGGVPVEILDQQSREKIQVPTLADACNQARAAARKAALPLIDTEYHTGKRLDVPGDFATIQAAIDAANRRDIVVVKAGTYFELIRMKDGVKLTSDGSGGGNEMTKVEGARLRLPQRALRTIIDGSKAKASRHGMIDFDSGYRAGHTIVDGFTLEHLPKQNHHAPGHAHGINVRGASPVVTHCLIQKNGSTGIGNHVVYQDQGSALGAPGLPLRQHRAPGLLAVVYHNIIRGNLGLGIGSNHFSTPAHLGQRGVRQRRLRPRGRACKRDGSGAGRQARRGARSSSGTSSTTIQAAASCAKAGEQQGKLRQSTA